jgi:arylsulfatase A-like enzyme
MSRRHGVVSLLGLTLAACGGGPGADDGPRPNVLLIITDDQGWGDVGVHGNPRIRTPNLDRLANESVRFDQFHVMPVCSPTRACLLTGRYAYRTGVVDTYLGRSLMHLDETTLAELLGEAGWRTGIFGKWHLGDNFPLRAQDQGFQETLTLKGGGIGQPSDPPGGDRYFDPTLYRNGTPVKTKGYVTDVITDGALRFIQASRGRPFFAYVAYNCPHDPLQAPPALEEAYRKDGLPDNTAKVYAMVENIDTNVGRLLRKLSELGVADDTLVVFMTDNGPAAERYNGGMRGRKGTVFQGGLRVPFFFRWPAELKPRVEPTPAAHVDVVPTVLEAARLPARPVDGRSLMPLLRSGAPLPERSLFFQWHRGDAPEANRACAVRRGRWKLVRLDPATPPLLFALDTDPEEKTDLAAVHPDVVARLQSDYDAWFKDVCSTRGFAPPRIGIGSAEENPVMLTRQDWRGPAAGWGPQHRGGWELEGLRAVMGEVRLLFAPPALPATVTLTVGGRATSGEVAAGARELVFRDVALPAGPYRLDAELRSGGETRGVLYAEVRAD